MMLIAARLFSRLRGLLFRRGFQGEILIVPCKDVHSFGMDEPIDVAFLDRSGLILASRRDLPPNRRCRCPGAYATIERFSKPGSLWYEPGQFVCLGVEYKEKELEHEDVPSM